MNNMCWVRFRKSILKRPKIIPSWEGMDQFIEVPRKGSLGFYQYLKCHRVKSPPCPTLVDLYSIDYL